MIVLRGVIDHGDIRVVYTPKKKQDLADFKKSLPEGTIIEIVFKKWDATRGTLANNYFHAINKKYALANGIDVKDTKILFKYQYGVWVTYEEAIRDFPSWSGQFVQYGNEIVYMKTTAEYTRKEFRDITEGVKTKCLNENINIEDIEKEYRG